MPRKDKEETRKYQAEYYQKHKEERQAAKKEYYQQNAEVRRQQQKEYDAQHKEDSKMFSFRCTVATESDIIAYLDSLENKAGYIKELIRTDILKHKEEEQTT